MRPITSYPKSNVTRHSTSSTAKLAPLPPSNESNITTHAPRPKTRSSLAVKNWRHNLFPQSSPASQREVELLGEWLNSVLAENLEQNDNPIDVCTNAQHWFSVAFNELVRQVAIDCAERGRLFAVIWKRNQDLLTKLVQVQKDERQYILECHKDRMQFLKTDLEFSQSRLTTISTAYDEEQSRWQNSHERDATKFDSLQQKIDEQINSRKELMKEISDLRKQLNLPDESIEEEPDEPAFSFNETDIDSFCQSFRWKMRNEKVNLFEIMNTIENISHYIDIQSLDTLNIRMKYEHYFYSLPSDAQPNIRPVPWVISLISYIYSTYMSFLSSNSIDQKIFKKSFSDVVYELLLNVYGTRVHAEQVLFDFLSTIRKYIDTGIQRLFIFARFFGLISPLSIDCFHFYLHALTMMNRTHSGPLFPEFEAGETMISGIPTPAASQAAQSVFQRISSGRTLKFYTERLNKIASDGIMRFGGKNLAELDNVLDYIVSAYVEETSKLEDNLKDQFNNEIPDKEITTYTQFHHLMAELKYKTDAETVPKMFHEALQLSVSSDPILSTTSTAEISTGGIKVEAFLEVIRKSGLNLPLKLNSNDFLGDQMTDDILKFVQMEYQEHTEMYQKIYKMLEEQNDDIMLKQLKAAKTKFDQALSSRSLGRTFQTIQREFYEKLYMIDFRNQ